MSRLTKLNKVIFLFVFIFNMFNISITDFLSQGKKNQMNDNNIPVTLVTLNSNRNMFWLYFKLFVEAFL